MGAWGTSEDPDAAVRIRRDDREARMDRGARDVDIRLASPGAGQIMAGKGEEGSWSGLCF